MGDLPRRVYWLMQSAADVTPGDGWLAPAERDALARLRSPKRRRDWRLGRWTAKQALARLTAGPASAALHLAAFVVGTQPNGAPRPSLDGTAFSWPLSISHSHDRAICAIAPAGVAVGCDLERVEPRTDDFTREWFTPGEQQTIARADPHERPRVVTLLWSAKESALKAIGAGLSMSTHSVSVNLDDTRDNGDWNSLRVTRDGDPESMAGWWRMAGADIITVVMTSALGQPAALAPFSRQD